MQGDVLATNNANRLAVRSSASAAGVHSVEGSFSDGVPITNSASAVCSRAATSNTNGLEPMVQSTLGLRDIPNAFSDAVCPVANQIGDGTVMETQGFVESSPPSILNANTSNVHGHHDLSALLLESRLDDISECVDGDISEDALIDDTYLGRAEEGDFNPQVALDLEAEFGGFSKDPSFLMESFQGDASSPSLRGSSNIKNGSHRGRGGGGRGAQMARGIQTNKPSIRLALCGKEGLSFQDKHRECPLGNRENQRGNERPSLE
ncbi:hypothetical protein F0562_032169 [Nyssa sinensis]|uniref:Uncharacterized protein n=1 Tax=Nyssa sinensis TaxID=561372 RepID=A0A5J5AY01_9ASTE|nr:hypothetical protein F0562_032169 [Nyssa sinensis]